MERTTACAAKPFIKWAGGKNGVLPSLGPMLPDDISQWSETVYVEPFVGGGAVLFHVLRTYPNIRRAIINDVNPKLAACYRVIRDNATALTDRLAAIEAEYYALDDDGRKAYFLSQRRRFNQGLDDETEQTAVFLLLNHTCFNGLFRVNRKGEFNVPFGRYPHPRICDAETIAADSRLLQKVEIMSADFEAVAAKAQGHCFYYLDPPYRPISSTAAFTDYAAGSFNDDDQRRLKAFCDRLNSQGHRFMLSNSDSRLSTDDPYFFDRLYANYHIRRIQATRAISCKSAGRGKVTEIVVRNYINDNEKL